MTSPTEPRRSLALAREVLDLRERLAAVEIERDRLAAQVVDLHKRQLAVEAACEEADRGSSFVWTGYLRAALRDPS